MSLTIFELRRYCAINNLSLAENLVKDGCFGYMFLDLTSEHYPEKFWKPLTELEDEIRDIHGVLECEKVDEEAESADGSVAIQDDGAGDPVDMGSGSDETHHEMAGVGAGTASQD